MAGPLFLTRSRASGDPCFEMTKTLRSWMLLTTTVSLAAACAEDPMVLKESTTVTIATEGGETSSADGALSLTFAAGAVAAETEVTIETLRDRDDKRLISPVYRVTPAGILANAGVAFDLGTYETEQTEFGFVDDAQYVPIDTCSIDDGAVRCDSPAADLTDLALFLSYVPPDRRLFAGGYWSCLHKRDRTIECWGSITTPNPLARYVAPPTGVFADMSKGHYHHTCARRDDGTVTCFGLLDLDPEPPANEQFTSFSAGAFQSCGIRPDETIACYGNDLYGEASPPPGKFTMVAAGITKSCGLRKDGHVLCWGDDLDPALTAPNGVAGPYVNVDVGDSVCAQKPDDTLDCWASIDEWPGEGSSFAAPTGKFDIYSMGTGHACGIRDDGVTVCWGHESGNGELTPPPGVSFVEVSCGQQFSCGLRADGQVQCWGENSFGQSTPPTF